MNLGIPPGVVNVFTSVTDWWRKQILKQNTSCIRKLQPAGYLKGRGGAHPRTLPLDPPLR